MKGRPWYETARTGLADPVLRRRLAAAGLAPEGSESTGLVFDLVTGGRDLREALGALPLTEEERAQLAPALLVAPQLEEVQDALRDVGRAEEAGRLRALEGLQGGEFEARAERVGVTPVASLESASTSGSPPLPGSAPAPSRVASAVPSEPSRAPGGTEENARPAEAIPSSAAAETTAKELTRVRELLEQALVGGSDVRLRALEARIDQLAATLRLAGFVGIAILVVLALSR
ncbi:MAG: hypothetical protein AAFZ18_31330 [Myxococcota bacterium]